MRRRAAVSASGALTINLPTSAPSGFSACDSYSWTIMSGSSVNAANMSIGTKWASGGTFGVSASGNTVRGDVYRAQAGDAGTGLTASDGSSDGAGGGELERRDGRDELRELFRNTGKQLCRGVEHL
ncbi:MAG: hypothetical protein ACOX3F_02065 [Kiritimatiellia bacterium]